MNNCSTGKNEERIRSEEPTPVLSDEREYVCDHELCLECQKYTDVAKCLFGRLGAQSDIAVRGRMEELAHFLYANTNDDKTDNM